MTQSDYISATVIRSLLQFLETKAIDTNLIAGELSIDSKQILDVDHLFPATLYPAIFQKAIEATGDKTLGLAFGISAEPNRWGVLGYIMSASKTLAEAMQCQQRYQSLVGSIGTLTITLNQNRVRLAWETKTMPAPALAEEAVAGWVKFGRWITESPRNPHRVCFKHSPQGESNLYTDFFGCPVDFNGDYNGLEMPLDFLALPLRHPDESTCNWLRKQADERLGQLDERPALLMDLQSFIEEVLPRQVPELADAAGHLELSTRKLQRKLKELDTNYKIFFEATRKQLAKRYLHYSEYSMMEITFLLGFSEQSAFNHAFKRWFKLSPGEFRKKSAE